MDMNLRAMNLTGVFISEVMVSNDSVVLTPNAGFTDWIEPYNPPQPTVDLSGYGLSDQQDAGGGNGSFPRAPSCPGEYKVVL